MDSNYPKRLYSRYTPALAEVHTPEAERELRTMGFCELDQLFAPPDYGIMLGVVNWGKHNG